MPDRQSAPESSYQQEAADGYFSSLAPAKYVRLTTFAPDDIPVSTSVHGVVDGDRPTSAPGSSRARPSASQKASWVAGKIARKYPFRQRFLIPLVHWTRRWQMMHYELLTYEAAVGQEVGPEAPPSS